MPRRRVDQHLRHLRRELAVIRGRLCAAGEGDPYRFEAVAGLLRERKRPAADGRVALADLLGLLARFSGVDPDELGDRPVMVFDELLDLSDEMGAAPDTRRLYERHVAAHMRDDATHAHLLQRPTGLMYDDLKTDREGRPLPQLAAELVVAFADHAVAARHAFPHERGMLAGMFADLGLELCPDDLTGLVARNLGLLR